MDYALGFQVLREYLPKAAPTRMAELATFEQRFQENERAERLFGSSENTRNERSQVIYALNKLALEVLEVSFNDLCAGERPPAPGRAASESGAVAGLQEAAMGGKGDGQVPVPVAPTPLGDGHRWAVLVGVNQYKDAANYGHLQVCVKDVTAIYEQLVAGGFDPQRIHLLTDDTQTQPTRADILESLQSVADATEPDDLLLFYYSGHGDEKAGQSYLIARDGRRLVLGDTAVPIARIREIIASAPARAKVIVLDACHSGANVGGKGPLPMSEEFIRRVFAEAEGLAILASCKQGQLSYEWRAQERSVFTHYLLEALAGTADRDQKGFVTVQDASRHVSDGVKLWASNHKVSQTPTLYYEVAGDIILARYAKSPES